MASFISILILSVLVGYIILLLRRLLGAIEANTHEVRELRLTSRARVKTASMQSGPLTDEQILTRLGRSSRTKRVVFGGDSNSDQYKDLGRQVRKT